MAQLVPGLIAAIAEDDEVCGWRGAAAAVCADGCGTGGPAARMEG